ncbi:LexA family transcriptional regulator [Gemella haemolysans]|uniref:DNA-binding helix-turn-helix protein n=1 Tax=Gemella haemolysans ATCC 10379 TaxID=546270 RepID=C5NXP5_9BACL|nr:XRE family transcriptional regulator [Gemella haemolysans]EER67654.1 DNA-binding helix-turn-helix protein [Gemella haemolysans ATCC 10379]KAA8708821.1 LexA family transcriptional regulator [Gemella haemolysans]UBH82758.1 XRE family transcriptional regulator [Gemella haemolysans]VEI38981.1 Helix-turn-helix [Gemella haemolysans]
MFCNNRLKSLRTKQKVSQTAVAKHLGVTRAAYNSWEKGKYIPNKKNLDELALYFNVETTYFESEYEIVNKYLQLNEINQKKLLTMANELYVSQLYKYQVHAKLSAGLGNFYYEDYEFDTVYFDKDISHDIASWIDGDSMEPKYYSGDVALIKKTGYDFDGLDYAVVYNEETYIKKVFLEENTVHLVSINDNYKDIIAPIEEVNIVGVVTDSFKPIKEV